MTICLDCGEMNKTHERHCQSCGQRLVRRIYWDAAIVQQSSSSELPCDDLPVQDWPFEAHAIELRRQLQPTIKLVMAVARQLLQQNSGSWETTIEGRRYELLEPHGWYFDAEAILDIWVKGGTGARNRRDEVRVASYAIFPGIIINVQQNPVAYLMGNTIYCDSRYPDNPLNHEASREQMTELINVMTRE